MDTSRHPLPPNALSSFEHIRELLQNKTPVVFLDYDGTLAPIVSRPDEAYMTETMRAAVKTVAEKFVTAVVTGRSTQKVVNFVKLNELFYAGSHGLDITGPSIPPLSPTESKSDSATTTKTITTTTTSVSDTGEIHRNISSPPIKHRVAHTFLPVLEKCRLEIANSLESILGTSTKVEIEDNLLTFSVHYRNAINITAEEVFSIINAILIKDEYSSHLVCTAGKMVYEIRPSVQWNKGTAVLWLLETLGMKGKEDVVAFYLGDDVTDEDAFLALSKSLNGRCASIVVQGERDNICYKTDKGNNEEEEYMHRPTSALWSLRDTVEVERFLINLSKIGAVDDGGDEQLIAK
jgi:trehalose 6-phosphate phosphatase